MRLGYWITRGRWGSETGRGDREREKETGRGRQGEGYWARMTWRARVREMEIVIPK